MPILIVESAPERAALWQENMEAAGLTVVLAKSQEAAVRALQTHPISMILMNLDLVDGSALAVADFANYRRPEIKVIFLTESGMLSDGSIFMHAGNACAILPVSTPPSDLAMMVEHYRQAL